MNYTHTESNGQLAFSETRYSFLSIPSRLEGFNNSDTTVIKSVSGREVFCFNGKLELAESDRMGRRSRWSMTSSTMWASSGWDP